MVKQEPSSYSFDDFSKDGATDWTGVRNYQARNNLIAMKKGDKVLFYHSGDEKAVVGHATVSKPQRPQRIIQTASLNFVLPFLLRFSSLFVKPFGPAFQGWAEWLEQASAKTGIFVGRAPGLQILFGILADLRLETLPFDRVAEGEVIVLSDKRE